jgi:hypothetical protein
MLVRKQKYWSRWSAGGLVLAAALATTSAVHAGKYSSEVEPPTRAESRSDSAAVYFLRTTSMGGLIYFWTFADEEFVGVTRGKSYFTAQLAPGEHVLWSKAENVAAVNLTVEAGRTYYVIERVVPGFGKARVRLDVVDAAEGEKALKKIKRQLVATDEAKAKAPELVKRHVTLARKRAAGDESEQPEENEAPPGEEEEK